MDSQTKSRMHSMLDSMREDDLTLLYRIMVRMQGEGSVETGKRVREPLDYQSYFIPTERGKNADEYIRELRENDRN